METTNRVHVNWQFLSILPVKISMYHKKRSAKKQNISLPPLTPTSCSTERNRERERDMVYVCACVCMCACVCVHVCVCVLDEEGSWVFTSRALVATQTAVCPDWLH